MNEIIKYAATGLMAIGYVWIIAKSSAWFFGEVLFRKAFKRKEKDRKQAAINELYDAYELCDMKPGDDLKIATKGGLVVFMYRRPEEWMSIIHITSYRMYRLRLNDGRYIYMTWHPYCGPTFFLDKYESRWIEYWYEDKQICDAVEWFVNRGKKA